MRWADSSTGPLGALLAYRVTDSLTGRLTTYDGYDSKDNLKKSTSFSGDYTEYFYNSDNDMTQSKTYGSSGLLKSTTDYMRWADSSTGPLGALLAYRVTDSLTGRLTTYDEYDSKDNLKKSTSFSGDYTEYFYNSDNDMTQSKTYGSSGLLKSTTDYMRWADSSTGPLGALLAYRVTDSLTGRLTTYDEYDSKDNLKKSTSFSGDYTEYFYNSDNDMTQSKTYGSSGLLKSTTDYMRWADSSTGPLGALLAYRVTDSLTGRLTTYDEYDSKDNLKKSTSFSGDYTEYFYNSDNDMTQSKTYGSSGLLKSTTDYMRWADSSTGPLGALLAYRVTDSLTGRLTTYDEYDSKDNLKKSTSFSGDYTEYFYNSDNDMTQSKTYGSSGLLKSTTDYMRWADSSTGPLGALLAYRVTDSLTGRLTTYDEYDSKDNLKKSTSFSGDYTEYFYNSDNDMTQSKTYGSSGLLKSTTDYMRWADSSTGPLGALLAYRVTDSLTGRLTTYDEYDSKDNLKKSTSFSGDYTEYFYNSDNDMTQSKTYGSSGLLKSTTDYMRWADSSTGPLGALLAYRVTDSLTGRLTTYDEYDSKDNLKKSTSFSGDYTEYFYNVDNDMTRSKTFGSSGVLKSTTDYDRRFSGALLAYQVSDGYTGRLTTYDLYDSKDNLKKSTSFNSDYTEYFYNADNDMTQSKTFGSSGVLKSTTDYDRRFSGALLAYQVSDGYTARLTTYDLYDSKDNLKK